MSSFDASLGKGVEEKGRQLRVGEETNRLQELQNKNPDSRIILGKSEDLPLLSAFADSYWGLGNGDSPRFVMNFWEVPGFQNIWIPQLTSPSKTDFYLGRENILRWEEGKGDLVKHPGAFIRGTEVWGKKGIFLSQMASLNATIYLGEAWDQNACPIIPKQMEHLLPILSYCQSQEYGQNVREIDQALKVTNASMLKVPFDLAHWQQVAAEKYPDGLPEPYSNDPTQWLFKGTVTDTTQPLQVAVARLCGYAWPEQVDDGLIPDADGIVPLTAMLGEKGAAERLQALLAQAYGPEWNAGKLRELLKQVEADSLETWLRDKFFDQHSKLFHHRPFLWHIWDGRKDGFSAIVNYHALTRQKLEKLTYTYLGEWIDRQRAASAAGEKGADSRLADALALQKKLEAILEGQPPYDIYVRWKELGEQPRGWNPDLNDGVRLNIRPFVEAGVLRAKVNVKWGKDRGNDPGKVDFGEAGPQTDLEKHQSSERHNDLHFTLAEKEDLSTRGAKA